AMLSGLAQTDRGMLDYLRMIGARRPQILFKLELPYALPYLFSGLKISATYCVMGAVVAEWLGAEKGIGQYLLLSEKNFRTDRVFAALFIIVLLSLILFALVQLVEARLVRWRPAGGLEKGRG
ncbi:MAG TPA: ABC transporter permease subunit, partial [Limnochordia bacterium]|nr:ABC transporter permease subunit [Limnochordia bacterium]